MFNFYRKNLIIFVYCRIQKNKNNITTKCRGEKENREKKLRKQ